MASFTALAPLLTPKVVSFLKAPSGLPELPFGLGYEVLVSPSGEPFRTGAVVTTGQTKQSALQIALAALSPLTSVLSGPTGVAATLAKQGLSAFAESRAPAFKQQVVGRIDAMAFQDGDSGFFGSFPSFGEIGQILQGPIGRGLLDVGLTAATGFINQQFAQPQIVQTSMAAAGPIMRAGGAVATVGRGFFNRFPNLATAIQGLRNRGANITRSQLWGMMKRFGPELMISGGILTAAAVSELMIAGPGRRRMNPGNVKALRRAHRRMKSFHNVCTTNDRLLGGRRSSKRKGSFGGATSVVNVK